MKNLKVSLKLIISFLIIAVLTAAVGLIGIFGLGDLNDITNEMYDFGLTSVRAMGNIREIFATQRNDLRNLFLSIDDAEAVNDIIDGVKASDAEAQENFALYETTIIDESSETDFYSARDTWNGAYADMKTNLYAALEAGDNDTAYQIFVDGGPLCIVPITQGLAKTTEFCDLSSAAISETATDTYDTLFIVLLVIVIVAVAAAVFFAVYLTGLIAKPLNIMSGAMKRFSTTGNLKMSKADSDIISEYSVVKDEIGQTIANVSSFCNSVIINAGLLEKIADGDLTVEVNTLSSEDTMGNSLKKMVENLNSMFGEINNASEQVTSGSSQISDGAQSLASGSTQQAATLQELSASISDISDKTKKNAEETSIASSLAGTIMKNAEKGSEQMEQMIAAVNEINHANQNISKVIKAIDDIAFQTNILALNAAVEAARAGAAGKGFAVVSDEVRSLAAKSAASARETGELIANSMEKAQLGTKIAGETAASLKEIVEGISESNRIISNIARSSEEQTVAISQINTAIGGVTQVVQQNSATAEESAAASEEMSGQASLLSGLIERFKLR